MDAKAEGKWFVIEGIAHKVDWSTYTPFSVCGKKSFGGLVAMLVSKEWLEKGSCIFLRAMS